jgi:hypothetical protein
MHVRYPAYCRLKPDIASSPKSAIIGLVQRSKHDPLLDHLVGAGAKAPPRVASAK